MTLDVLIATHSPRGLEAVERMQLPAVDRVRYVVSWQEHGGVAVPESLARREDVEIHRLDERGLARNRNNAIRHSRADIMLTADNDLYYTPQQLKSVIRAFEDNPEVEIGVFEYEGSDAKAYPKEQCPLNRLPKGYFTSAIEIAVRRTSRTERLLFPPEFGLGSGRWEVGEDSMFLLAARRMGLCVTFFPIVITRHDGPTTGLRPMTNPRALRGTGACIALEYPLTAPLRIPLKAWREWRVGRMNPLKGLVQMTLGALDATFRYTPPWKNR